MLFSHTTNVRTAYQGHPSQRSSKRQEPSQPSCPNVIIIFSSCACAQLSALYRNVGRGLATGRLLVHKLAVSRLPLSSKRTLAAVTSLLSSDSIKKSSWGRGACMCGWHASAAAPGQAQGQSRETCNLGDRHTAECPSLKSRGLQFYTVGSCTSPCAETALHTTPAPSSPRQSRTRQSPQPDRWHGPHALNSLRHELASINRGQLNPSDIVCRA